MKEIEYCYHCHTYRCGHAFGEDEEYVQKAIECGIKRLGFSDHIFLPAGYEQQGIRRTIEDLDDYLNSIHALKEKYASSVEILVGFEAEFTPDLVDYYKWLLANKVDYLIMGQHCTRVGDNFEWYFYKDCPIECIRHYVDDVVKGLETGLFKYLAHPDLFMHSQAEWNADLEDEARRIFEACERLNIPIEINVCGMRRRHYNEVNYSYPNINFFKIASEYNLKVVIGVDAHDPSHFKKEDIKAALEFAERCGLKVDFDHHI